MLNRYRYQDIDSSSKYFLIQFYSWGIHYSPDMKIKIWFPSYTSCWERAAGTTPKKGGEDWTPKPAPTIRRSGGEARAVMSSEDVGWDGVSSWCHKHNHDWIKCIQILTIERREDRKRHKQRCSRDTLTLTLLCLALAHISIFIPEEEREKEGEKEDSRRVKTPLGTNRTTLIISPSPSSIFPAVVLIGAYSPTTPFIENAIWLPVGRVGAEKSRLPLLFNNKVRLPSCFHLYMIAGTDSWR